MILKVFPTVNDSTILWFYKLYSIYLYAMPIQVYTADLKACLKIENKMLRNQYELKN